MRNTKTGILYFDPDMDKTEQALRRAAQLARERTYQQETIPIQDYSSDESEMGEEHRITLGNYGRLDNLNEVSLGFQPANPVVFDIKNNVLVNLKSNQFLGKETDDCNAHLKHFIDAYITINPARVSESDKRLRMFGYSLTGRAIDWLDALPSGPIETWDQLKREFLDRNFPTAKYLARKKEISSFNQQEEEVLYDTWEMFKLLLNRCPGQKISEVDVMQAFTKRLKPDNQMLQDASARGTMKIKTVNEARALIDNMYLNEY